MAWGEGWWPGAQGHPGPFVSRRKPVVCGITSLGIDHTGLLGDTMEKIAWQKGGIFQVTWGGEVHGWPDPGPQDSGKGRGAHLYLDSELGLGISGVWVLMGTLCGTGTS